MIELASAAVICVATIMWFVYLSVKFFATTKYAGQRDIDKLRADIDKLETTIKKYESEKLLDKVRTLDNRFGRL